MRNGPDVTASWAAATPPGFSFARKISRLLTRYAANPYWISRSTWCLVKFGPIAGIAFAAGSSLVLLPTLSILGPGDGYTFLALNVLLYPPVILFFSVFRFRAFSPRYWSQTIHEIRSGTWQRPPAILFGGLFPAAATTLVLAAIYRVRFFDVADTIAPATMIGIALARFACLNYGCCFGYPALPDAPFTISYGHPDSWPNRVDPANAQRPRFPVQALEILAGLLLSVPIFFTQYFGHVRALPTALFFLLYGLLRFCTEFLRQPEEQTLHSLTVWQWVSIACLAIGFGCFAFCAPRPPMPALTLLHLRKAPATVLPLITVGFLQLTLGFGFHKKQQPADALR